MLHPSLPQTFTPEQLAAWLKNNAVEKFTDERKIYFTDDEKDEIRKKIVNTAVEINDLDAIHAKVKTYLKEGVFTEDEAGESIVIPNTKGLKILLSNKRFEEDRYKRGYDLETRDIYGIPNAETENMDFFDVTGTEIIERCRPLSPREKQMYIGIFSKEFRNNKKAS